MKKNLVLAVLIGAIIGGTTVTGIDSVSSYMNEQKQMKEFLERLEERKKEIQEDEYVHYVKDGYEYWEKEGKTIKVKTEEAEPIHVVVAKNLFE